MKLHSPSFFAVSAAAVAATTMVSSFSFVSSYLLTCQIETRFQFDGAPDGSPPATPSMTQLQNMGVDLMTTFQAAYANNDGIDMLNDRFSRFKMKRIKNPDFFDDDGDDDDDDEDLALFEAGLVDPEDVAELVADLEDDPSLLDETTVDTNVDREGNLRRGSISASLGDNDTEGHGSTIGEKGGPDDKDSTRLGIPGRAKRQRNRRRRRRRTRPPTRRPKPVYEKVKWDSNANFKGSVQCNWCDDDRRVLYLTGSSPDTSALSSASAAASATTKNGSVDETIPATMGLGTANEHHEWETTFCGRLKATFPHATHCYISVSECNYGGGGSGSGGGNAAVLESGPNDTDADAHPQDGITHYIVSDFMDQIPTIDADPDDDGSVDEMVVYTVQALNPDQVSSFLLSSSPTTTVDVRDEA